MLALLLFAPPAVAYDETGILWPPDAMPVHWQMDNATEDSLAYTTEELLALIVEARNTWYDAECAAISEVMDPIAEMTSPDPDDNVNGVYWDDPGDDFEPGILGVTIPGITPGTIVRNGRTYAKYKDQDVAFNNNVEWGTPEEIRGAGCSNAYDLLGVATHEFGHFWGMGHSCERDAACATQLLRDATMYWSVSSCDPDQSDLNQDDIDGITTLYGPYGQMGVLGDRSGKVPFAVQFEVDSEYPVASVSWNFGDGDSSTELAPEHVFENPGQYTVTADMELEDETCGTYTYTASERGYVTACDEPGVEDGATGFFTMQPESGLTWQTFNRSDVSIYGCIDTIAWQVYEGSGETAITPENLVDFNGDDEGDTFGAWSPKIEFPAPGAYTVVMNVGGPGGLVASYLAVEVVDVPVEGEGCAAVPASAGLFGLLGAVAAAAARRRRAN